MKTFLLFIACLFCSFILNAQYSQDSAWIRDNYVKKEVYITARDGVRLFTSIYYPKDSSEKHPILLTRTPYSCAPYGPDEWMNLWNNYRRYYAHEGYIFVKQDVRGRWMSEGDFVDVRPFNPNKKNEKDIDESTDTYDAIDWLVKNVPNNNGKVGVYGISYPGFYSTMAALSGHPALKAVSPQAPVTDWFLGDDFHHNGALFPMDGFAFYSGFGKPRPKPTTEGSSGYKFTTPDNYDFYLKTGALKNLTELIGDSIAFWKDLMSHPTYDTFWKARNVRNFVQNVPEGTATLVVGGLFDAEDCYGAWRTYGAIEKKSANDNKLVMGPWYHGQWASADGTHMGNIHFGTNTSQWFQNNIEIPFFNYYLKGKGSLASLPEATIFFTGENTWKKFTSWPPKEKQDRTIYLEPDGKLGWQKSDAKNSFSEYISDPAHPVPYTEDVHLDRTREYMDDDQRFASRRPDVLVFQTDVLTDDVTVGGTLVANLVTSISTTDADFVVKLIDVFPDNFTYNNNSEEPEENNDAYPMGGYQMLVRGEIMRGKFRKSFEQPQPFIPGKIDEVSYELPDIAHTFKKGHRIMVQVQSSWFPLADRNPQQFMDIYKANDKDFKKSTIKIYHDASHASNLVLPILK